MNAAWGKQLESYLDTALGQTSKRHTTPAFLEDPMFDVSGSTSFALSPHSKDTGHSLGVSSPRSRTSKEEIGDEIEDSQATDVEEDPHIQEKRQKLKARVHRAKVEEMKAELLLEDVVNGNSDSMTKAEAEANLEEAKDHMNDVVELQEDFGLTTRSVT